MAQAHHGRPPHGPHAGSRRRTAEVWIAASGSDTQQLLELRQRLRDRPLLTDLEETRLLGSRGDQLNKGAQPSVPPGKRLKSSLEIAALELASRTLPMAVTREYPGGEVREIPVNNATTRSHVLFPSLREAAPEPQTLL
eukprot:TRINITY_DN16156_c0_g1_i1.p2 TRINITY_DN16156_c0_g1~~TRINITY_DN16156_c0_g1_i1.p2  ORF type:complete len:139 (-),score=40.07 TRINITY_DN16156_c0_g1_i1:23-439(-)